jgi:hypothetical protein
MPAKTEFLRTHSFVVQFRAGDGRANGELSGRVEHVASGKAEKFRSIRDLPELLRRMLEGWQTDEAIARGGRDPW